MSTGLIYNELFRLVVTHQADSGFERTVSKDIHLEPTLATRKILRNAKMLFKPTLYGGVVLFRAKDNDRTPMISVAPGTAFSFYIEPANKAEFMNHTNLDVSGETFDASRVLFFQQTTASAGDNESTLQYSPTAYLIAKPISPLFNYEFELVGTASNVGLKVETTGLEYTGLSPLSGNTYRRQVDMRNTNLYPPGKYDVTVSYDDGGPQMKKQELYVDDQLAAAGPIGLVEIIFDPLHYTNIYECTIAFNT